MHNINVCIVGLSGNENVKGVEGVGKSCVCSRFLAKEYDGYRRDHISNIALSDWHSSVVNKSHWLYWGSCQKRIELVRHDPAAASTNGGTTGGSLFTSTITNSGSSASGSGGSGGGSSGEHSHMDICFNLIEQTEFINDETLSPFSEEVVGANVNTKLQPYFKRCSRTFYESPHKSVYRRKEQFSVQDYNYGKFPQDGLNVDGFICIVDTNDVYRRLPFSKQLSQLTVLLNELAKTKKHILIVSTKHDVVQASSSSPSSPSLVVNQCEKNRRELESYLSEMRKSSKELGKYLYSQFVETSADLNINVDSAFYLLALNVINSKHFNKFRNSLTIKYDEGHEKYIQTRHKMMNLYGYLLKHESAPGHNHHLNHHRDEHHANGHGSSSRKSLLFDSKSDEPEFDEIGFNYKLKFEQFYSQNLGDVNRLIELYGISFVLNYFNQHMSKLLQMHVSRASAHLVKRLPRLLDVFFPSKSEKLFYLNNPWSRVAQAIRAHKLFSKYIIAGAASTPSLPSSPYMSSAVNDCLHRRSNVVQSSAVTAASAATTMMAVGTKQPAWYENEYFFKTNLLALPQELFTDELLGPEFESHVKVELEKIKLNDHKAQLLNLLKVNAAKHNIRPGKSWQEASVFVMGRECYESLGEHERQEVYELFQRKLVRKAKSDYLEMLIENLERFLEHYLAKDGSNSSSGSLFQTMLEEHLGSDESLYVVAANYADLVADMIDQFKADQRHQRLDRLEHERKSTFIKFVEFVFGRLRDSANCLFGTFCIDQYVHQYLCEHLRLKATTSSGLGYASYKKKLMSREQQQQQLAQTQEDTTGEEKTNSSSQATPVRSFKSYDARVNNKNDSLESFDSYRTTSSWSSCHSVTESSSSRLNEPPTTQLLRRTLSGRSAASHAVNVSFICMPQLAGVNENPFKTDFNLAGFKMSSVHNFKLTAKAYILNGPESSPSSVFKNLLNKIRVNSSRNLSKSAQVTNGLVLMVDGGSFHAQNYQTFVQVLKKIRNYFNRMKKQDSIIHKSMKLFVLFDTKQQEAVAVEASQSEKNLVELCEKNMISFVRYDRQSERTSSSAIFRGIVNELVAENATSEASSFQPKRSLRKNNSKKLKSKLKRRSSQKGAGSRYGSSSSSRHSSTLRVLCLIMCNNDDLQIQCVLDAIRKHIKMYASARSDAAKYDNKVVFDAYLTRENRKQRVCLEFMSYHRGIELLKEDRVRRLYSGCILTFTSRRLASLKCAEAFAKRIQAAPESGSGSSAEQLPAPRICFVCISYGGVCDLFKDETSHSVILMGNQLADSFKSKFMILSSKMGKSQYGIFGKFFQECVYGEVDEEATTTRPTESLSVGQRRVAASREALAQPPACSSPKSEHGDVREDYMGVVEDVSIESFLLSSLAKQEENIRSLIESRNRPHETRVVSPLDLSTAVVVVGSGGVEEADKRKEEAERRRQSKAPLAKAESIESELFKSFKRSMRSRRRKRPAAVAVAKLSPVELALRRFRRLSMPCDDPRLRVRFSNIDDVHFNVFYKEHLGNDGETFVPSFRLGRRLPTHVTLRLTRSEHSRVFSLRFGRRLFKPFKTIKTYPNFDDFDDLDESAAADEAHSDLIRSIRSEALKSRSLTGVTSQRTAAGGRKFNRYFQKSQDAKIVVCSLVNTHSVCFAGRKDEEKSLARGDKSSSLQEGHVTSFVSSAASTSSSISFSSSYSNYSNTNNNQQEFMSLGHISSVGSNTMGAKLDELTTTTTTTSSRKKPTQHSNSVLNTSLESKMRLLPVSSSKESSSNKTNASGSNNKLDFDLDSMETPSLPVMSSTVTSTPATGGSSSGGGGGGGLGGTLSKLHKKKNQLHTTVSSSALASSGSGSSSSAYNYHNIATNLNNKRKTLLNDFQSFVQPASSLLKSSKHHHNQNSAVISSESSTSIINSLDADKFTISIENEKISLQTGIPIIVDKCLAYIEEHGLLSEGIYRVPGNKQYTDSLLEDLLHRQEYVDLKSYNKTQINANIVSTVIKDYFRHLREPILCNTGASVSAYTASASDFGAADSLSSSSFSRANAYLDEYIELSRNYLFPSSLSTMDLFKSPSMSASLGSGGGGGDAATPTPVETSKHASVKGRKLVTSGIVISSPVAVKIPEPSRASPTRAGDQADHEATPPASTAQLSSKQVEELAGILQEKFAKFSRIKYLTLKAVFMHLRLVASHAKTNSMDSNNLAICWWPTLLRPNFTSLNDTQVLCKILKPFVQFLIDHADLVFKR